jgi:peptide/nickel transport system ATP-binding protein
MADAVSAEIEAAPGQVARVADLRVSFPTAEGRVQAVRSVSLEIGKGEILAVVGESGSGKSVLGLSLLGLLPAAARPVVSGTVEVAGIDMLNASERSRRQVRRHLLGAVFQDPLTSLNPTMRVGHQLTERGVPEERALHNLVEAGVSEPARRARQFPFELSGGLRQRAMIAMALGTATGAAPLRHVPGAAVVDRRGVPHLIVADEPTTALDVSVQAQIVLLFDRLRQEHGCSIFFVTHDLGVAASIADRIAVMYAGRLCEIGPAASVLARPTHPYTRALLAARLSIDSSGVRSIPGQPPTALHLPHGCAFAPRCPNAAEDCLTAPPELQPRPANDGHGEAACLHPHVDSATSAKPTPARQARTTQALGESALELRNVSKAFPIGAGQLGFGREKLHAVSNVSLSVPSHSSLGLVGESGCGKTTTLRLATGLLRPDSGTVHWPANAGRPQLVFQDAGSSLTPWMRVGPQIAERLARRGVPRGHRGGRVIDLLQRVGLDARAAKALPRELSGGQRQRAAIARALASEPRVLICDEPVSALDASLVIQVLELLESLRDQLGVALLVVTHDLAVARRVADKVAVMYRGRIVEQGPVEEVFRQPAHPNTQGLLAAIPTTEPGRLSPMLAGEPPSAIGEVAGCAFAPRCRYARDRCVTERPPLYEVSAGRTAACHFFPEVLADGHATRTAD